MAILYMKFSVPNFILQFSFCDDVLTLTNLPIRYLLRSIDFQSFYPCVFATIV